MTFTSDYLRLLYDFCIIWAFMWQTRSLSLRSPRDSPSVVSGSSWHHPGVTVVVSTVNTVMTTTRFHGTPKLPHTFLHISEHHTWFCSSRGGGFASVPQGHPPPPLQRPCLPLHDICRRAPPPLSEVEDSRASEGYWWRRCRGHTESASPRRR